MTNEMKSAMNEIITMMDKMIVVFGSEYDRFLALVGQEDVISFIATTIKEAATVKEDEDKAKAIHPLIRSVGAECRTCSDDGNPLPNRMVRSLRGYGNRVG